MNMNTSLFKKIRKRKRLASDSLVVYSTAYVAIDIGTLEKLRSMHHQNANSQIIVLIFKCFLSCFPFLL